MQPVIKVSRELRNEIWRRRAEGTKQADIARAANVHPTTASALLNDLIPVQPGDARVLALARVVGVSAADAFMVIRTDRPEVQRG